jgi:hypothetical protein
MNPLLVQLLMMIAEEAATQGPAIWNDIAHGEGGTKKIAKVLGDLSAVTGHVATAIAPAA